MPNNQALEVSFGALRVILADAFWTLLGYIPTGDEPAIDLAVQGDGEAIPIEADDPHAQLDLLVEFAKAARLLAMERTPEEVWRLMADGVAQRIVAGDESWAQELIN